jgi:hypothetical protein
MWHHIPDDSTLQHEEISLKAHKKYRENLLRFSFTDGSV